MKVGVYLRVSTERQDEANQEAEINALCTQRGWSDRVVYRETISGAAKTRPVLEGLCTDAHRGRVGAIVVWSLDRLGRSMWDVIDRVRALDAKGIPIVSVKETWLDTGGPAHALLLSVFAWVAEQERTRLRDRTRAALNVRREQIKEKGYFTGKRSGVARQSLGRPRVVLPPAARARAELMRSNGAGWRSISKWLVAEGYGRIPPTTLARIMKEGKQ